MTPFAPLSALLLAAACVPPTDSGAKGASEDSGEARCSPSAEVCDGVDNDCDGDLDEAGAELWYADEDGDGFGDDSSGSTACDRPAGAVSVGGDCDDQDDDVYPGQDDYPNNKDDDCDGEEGEDDEGCDCIEPSGYFVVGELAEDWTCVDYYRVVGEDRTSRVGCPDCDFVFYLWAEHVEGALEDAGYSDCAPASLEFWPDTDNFYSYWAFTYEPSYHDSPVVYYYSEGSGFYPWMYLYYGSGSYGDYLSWTTFDETDSDGNRELGLFMLYMYTY